MLYKFKKTAVKVTDCFIHLPPERKKNHADESEGIHTHSFIIVYGIHL